MIRLLCSICLLALVTMGSIKSAPTPEVKPAQTINNNNQQEQVPSQQFATAPIKESQVEYALSNHKMVDSDESKAQLSSPTTEAKIATDLEAPPVPLVASISPPTKLKRDSRAKLTSLELDSQDTFLHPHPDSYPAQTPVHDSGYDYDSGKNSYGKHASDWSQYDHGNDGLYDKYGDRGWNDQGHKAHSAYGKHDSYGNAYNSQNGGHGSGYYSRDRGYGYEKHYAYDKEVASKHHSDNRNDYGHNYGLHDYYGNSASAGHQNQGHDRYGQLSRYGNHGYGKKAGELSAHYDYGHDHNKGHYYAQHIPSHSTPVHHSYGHATGYSSHSPPYKTSYSDYSPYVGYPSSYPSYY